MFKLCVVGAAVILLASCEDRNESNVKESQALSSNKPIAATPVVKSLGKAYDGPLGLAMGIPVKEIINTLGFKEAEPNTFAGTPPKPVPDFDTYLATATANQGLCTLLAMQEVKVVNDTGAQLKDKVDDVAEMLSLKYGKHSSKIDFATQDVYRTNPQFWMMALKEDAVTYAYYWKAGNKGKTLPNNLEYVEVFASTSSMNSGNVVVKYFFENKQKCVAEMKSQKAANF